MSRSRLLATLLLVSPLFVTMAQADPGRWHRMAITPFAYDVTEESQAHVYELITPRTDLFAHHIDDGVPWPEAYAGEPYHENVEADLQERLANTPPGRPVYLAMTPLNNERDAMAGYWAEESNGERPGEWADKTFDDPMVITAYLNYCRDLIDRFDPHFVNFAIEANHLGVSTLEEWPAFMVLIRAVHETLSREYPGLPLFVSHVLKHPDSDFMTTARPLMAELMEHSDWMTVSVYGYLWGEIEQSGNPDNLPPNWLTQATDLAPGRPFAISEIGWLAETLWLPSYFLFVEGRPEWQDAFVAKLFAESNALRARYIVWFLAVDYDRAWEVWSQMGLDEGFSVWRDTGLWDGNVTPRPSLARWEGGLTLSRSASPPPTPGGRDAPGVLLEVSAAGDDALTVSWDAATCPAADYHLVWLDLATIGSYAVVDETCGAGATGSWTGPAPAGSVAVLAVSDDGGEIEGSHGVDAAGRERPSRSTACGFLDKIAEPTCRP